MSEEVEENDLVELFKKTLPQVQVTAVRLIRDKVDQSKRGIAFVDVATQAMAEMALQLNQKVLKGRQLLIFESKDQAEETKTAGRTVFLSNLPLTASEVSIRALASERIGEVKIEEIRLIRDAKGKVKGFAYIQL